MARYSYSIDRSTIRKTAGKEHYSHIGIGYTAGFQMFYSYQPSSSLPPSTSCYIEGDISVRRINFENNEFSYIDDVHKYGTPIKYGTGTVIIGELEENILLWAWDSGHNEANQFPVSWVEGTTNYILGHDPDVWYEYSGSKAVPVPSSSFTGGFIDRKESKSIKFGTEYNNLLDEQYTVASGTFYYKNTNDANYTSIALVGDTVTIPANTFLAEETYDAYADLTLDDGTTCTYTLDTITTTDGTPAVTAIAPSNIMVYGSATFRWDYENEYGTDQYAYDLQISDDNGATWTTLFNHEVSIVTSADYSGIATGTYKWRVRGYNNDDVASEWSNVLTFICSVPPSAPTITEIVPGGRITVKWSADNQAAYRILVQNLDTNKQIFDSGDIYSTAKQALINYYLIDGHYKVLVRITSKFGMSSDYGYIEYTQTGQLADPTVIASFGDMTGVVIEVTDFSNYEKMYIIRDGILIGSSATEQYMDFFVSGPVSYDVICVDSNDDFGIAHVTANATWEHSKLIRKNGTMIDVDSVWGGLYETSQTENTRYEVNEYLGASVPTHAFSKMRVKRFEIVFDDVNRIAGSLLGEVVFFADTFGNSDWVVPVTRSRADRWYGNTTQMEMELTDGEEEIEYEV